MGRLLARLRRLVPRLPRRASPLPTAARRTVPAGRAHGRAASLAWRGGRQRWAIRARFAPARAGAALGVLIALGGLYGAANSTAFELSRIDFPTLRWTDPVAVRSAVSVPLGTNLFAVETRPIVDRLLALPSVASARIEIGLPDRLAVRVVEREAIVIWAAGDRRFLVDRTGRFFGIAGDEAAGLPVVTDTRRGATALSVGSTLDPVDLDAATRLASLVPVDIGSAAQGLAVSVTDENGFVVRPVPADWTAIFGRYTPTVRTTDLIPGQVRLLRLLLAGREGAVGQIILADDQNGTYIPKPGASVR
jgi:cell division septal protein FtsQ